MSSKALTPEGWREVKLGEVAEIVTGKTPPTKNKLMYGNRYPFITPTDIDERSRFCTPSRYLSKEGRDYQSSLILPKGTICYTCIASIGKVCITMEESFTNQQINSLKVYADIANSFYIFYYLRHITPQLESIAGGTTTGIINKTSFSNTTISLPPLTEQKVIAEILSSLDDKIDLLRRQNETLETMAQTLFKRWFVEEARDDWESRRINNITTFSKGLKPQKKEKRKFQNSLPLILIETFDSGNTLFSEKENMVIANNRDILMVMDGASSGRIEIGYEGVIGSTIGLFRTLETFNYPFFVFCFLKHQERYIKENTTGSAIPHVDRGLVSYLNLSFPNIERVKKFEAYAQSIFTKMKDGLFQIQSLEQSRDNLLPKLMRGEVKVRGEVL